ncbi:MAG: NAD(P)H-hydrate dehydratase [Micrococcales bacterium]|nr:NAD(P)H-hydrate dehydratase [Micrococcales bacterium]
MTEPVVVTPAVLREWLLPASQGDKSTARILIVGGSAGTPGAVLLSAEAALRVGAGKLQIATVDHTATALSVAVPEALVIGLPTCDGGDIAAEAADEIASAAEDVDALLVGPGMLDPKDASALLLRLLPQVDVPVVIDALGMAAVTADRECVAHLDGRAVLTPNTTELARTLARDEGDLDLPEAVRELATTSGAVVVSGASTSYIADPAQPDRLWRNDSGTPGMATSGSGDVLAGAVAGMVSRGADPAQAAVWASYLHGRAGERLASEVGPVGFLARQLPLELPHALAEVEL